MRCFIAIELPEKIRARIFHESEILEGKKLFGGKITEKENLHLTLKFLGEISEEKIKDVIQRLKKINFPRFGCSVGKSGFFDNEKHIRIIWVELISEELEKLEREISETLREFSRDFEKFSPHITIARVESIRDRKGLIENVRGIHLKNSEFEVKEIVLMKSELKSKNPVYKIIEKVEL